MDALSGTLRALPSTVLQSKPRMADFARFAVAAEGALGFEAGTFLQAYSRNRQDVIEISLESDPVAVAVRFVLEETGESSGTATELLGILDQSADQRATRSASWPKAPRALSNRLRRIAPFLHAVGIGIENLREGHDRARKIVIRRAESSGKPRSCWESGSG